MKYRENPTVAIDQGINGQSTPAQAPSNIGPSIAESEEEKRFAMTTLTNDNIPSTLASTGLSIRIVQPGMEEQLVALPFGKCAVGSSDRCQVHLPNDQVRPLHCLIVQEPTGTTVRRWAPGALLNDQDFVTAPFQPGDCLQFGDVQLTLVADASPVPEVQPEQPMAMAVSSLSTSPKPIATRSAFVPPSPSVDTLIGRMVPPETTVDCTHEVERLMDRLRTANEGARQRGRKLVGSLRTMRNEAINYDQRIDKLEQQLSTALEEREQIFTQLSQRQDKAGERESQSSAEIDRLIGELTTAYEKAGNAEAALVEHTQQTEESQLELASLRGQRDQWEQVRSASELQRTQLTQTLADREQTLETVQAEFNQARNAADQADESRMEQAAQMTDLQTELDQVLKERDKLTEAQAKSLQSQQEIEQSLADSDQNMAVFQLELEKFQLISRQTDQELSETNAAFESLQEEVTQLAEERDQLATKRTEYQLREQGWEHELSNRDSQIEKLSSEIERLNTSIVEANQGVAVQGSQVESFQQQVDVLTTERDQLLITQTNQILKNKEWEEAITTRDLRIKELEEEHDGICQVLQSVEKGAFEQVDFANKLQGQLDKLRSERDQLASALPEQQDYSKQIEQVLAERDGQITLLSEELTKTSERQSELEIRLASGTSASQALEAEVAELRTRGKQLAEEQSSSEQSKAVVEQKLAESEQQVEQLHQQMETSQQQQRDLEQEVARGSQSSETVQVDFSELKNRYEQLVTESQAETQRRQELDEQLAERQQNIELFQIDLKSIHSEFGRATEQVASLQAERETLNQQLTGLREELAAQELASQGNASEVAAGDTELQRERDEVASELAAVRFQLEEFQKQGVLAGNETAAVRGKMTQLEEEKSLLQQHAEQQEQQTEQRTAELQDLQKQWSATQTEFEQIKQLYQQSQSDLEQARQCLQVAEQALQERIVVPTPVEEQPSSEPVEAYGSESSNVLDEETVELEPVTEESTSLDPDANLPDEVEEELPSPVTVEAIESTSTAFDRQETEAEQPKEEFQPTSFIDQYQNMLSDDEDTGLAPVQPESEHAPVENKLSANLDTRGSGGDEDDAALEAYMSNMLRRMRGDDSYDEAQPLQASGGTAQDQNSNPAPAVGNAREPIATESELAEESQDSEPLDLEQLKRSSRKPALPTDLAAMRELANSSARGAIAKHQKRRHLEKALGLFFLFLMFICFGGYMLLTATAAQEFLGPSFLGGALAVLIGLVGGFRLLGQLLLAIREGAWEKNSAKKSA